MKRVATSGNPEELFDIKQPLDTENHIYAAVNNETQQPVSIQIIPLEEASPDGLKKETAILRKLSHPNVVRQLGTYTKSDHLWIVSESYYSNCYDYQKLLGKNYPEWFIKATIYDVLKGLAYLHWSNVIHRNVQASNIFLKKEGIAQIGNFGVSSSLNNTMSKASTVVGTPFWMAPEVCRSANYDYKADIWSLGITCVELACGAPPLSNLPPLRAILMIGKGVEVKLTVDHDDEGNKFSQDFQDFIKQCCTKEAKLRPKAEELMKHKWFDDLRFDNNNNNGKHGKQSGKKVKRKVDAISNETQKIISKYIKENEEKFDKEMNEAIKDEQKKSDNDANDDSGYVETKNRWKVEEDTDDDDDDYYGGTMIGTMVTGQDTDESDDYYGGTMLMPVKKDELKSYEKQQIYHVFGLIKQLKRTIGESVKNDSGLRSQLLQMMNKVEFILKKDKESETANNDNKYGFLDYESMFQNVNDTEIETMMDEIFTATSNNDNKDEQDKKVKEVKRKRKITTITTMTK